ncbi:MAG: hypothetical protein WC146_03010 [Patescibacteria group bacterium]
MENLTIKKNAIISIINNEEGLYYGNLRYYFREVFQAPNARNPYHNFRHSVYVFCQVYEGGRYENLNKADMRALLIAALFHDYGHSGRIGQDREEIKNTIKSLSLIILNGDDHLWHDIRDLIESTEWPHPQDRHVFKSMKILRDADISQIVDDVWWQQVIFGLSLEHGVPPISQLKNEINFLSKLQFESDWGKMVYQPKIDSRIREIEEFLEVLV